MNKPLINILIRTSGRPLKFKNCIQSIREQTYKNVRLLVSVHDNLSENYVKKHTDLEYFKYEIIRKTDVPEHYEGNMKCRYAPYNLLLNNLMNEVKEGYIIYLDDDDKFKNKKSLQKIVSEIEKRPSRKNLFLWYVDINGKLVPSPRYFGSEPLRCQISTIGVCFHSDNKHLANWTEYTLGDYRVITSLYKQLKPVWINDVLTATQGQPGKGKRIDK